MEVFIYTFYFVFLVLMMVQGMLTLYLTLYVWEDPVRLKKIASPDKFSEAHTRFTVLLPAKNEHKVIGKTIQTIISSHYPKRLIELLIICEEKDILTIQAAQRSINRMYITNAKVITFNDTPVNKPHALNKGLSAAKDGRDEVIVIFDAEDEVNPEIFNIANTFFITDKPDIIQAGVQLMNYHSRWFSGHNVLEYYFWFKSRMHFHTKAGMVPLGGNTVFFKTNLLRKIKGWNETCLTEDAEIGIRLSVAGAKILSTYDPKHVTKEETPSSVGQFIKQRTRWNQGFIQILKLGYWNNYDTFFKRTLCFYTLSFPIIQAFLLIVTPFTLYLGIVNKFPLELSLLSFIPLLIVCTQMVINAIGMREFIIEQKLPHHKSVYVTLLITLLPYQFLLGLSALRAVFRELRGLNNCEKTMHYGIHRDMEKVISFIPVFNKQAFRTIQYERPTV